MPSMYGIGSHSLLASIKTPEELWAGRPISITQLLPFGHSPMVSDHRSPSKLDPRYVPSRLTGYQQNSSYHRILLESGKVVESRDVKPLPDCSHSPAPAIAQPLEAAVPIADAVPPVFQLDAAEGETGDLVIQEEEGAEREAEEDDEPEEEEPRAQGRKWAIMPYERSTAPSPEPVDHDGSRRSDRRRALIRRSGHIVTTVSTAPDALIIFALAAAAILDLPQNYKEARRSPQWEL
jgi:hypothetical protein